MPYKSDAQRKKFHVLEAQGKIAKATVDEFDQASKGMELPEHVKSMSQDMKGKKMGKTKHGHDIVHY